jgi:hypothetical protein
VAIVPHPPIKYGIPNILIYKIVTAKRFAFYRRPNCPSFLFPMFSAFYAPPEKMKRSDSWCQSALQIPPAIGAFKTSQFR